jgi:pantetheine-phosphate adenylyltransferase
MSSSREPYKTVVLGGTFDHFHKGHEALLRKAAETANFMIIGVTSDKMVKRSKDHPVSSYREREKVVEEYLRRQGIASFTVLPIEDPYGPTLSIPDIDAIVVSEETRRRAKEINDIRLKKGLKPLKIVTIGQVLSEDGKPITTARILKGEIDRNGKLIKNSDLVEKH